MITKEQVKEILTKNPAGITKEELKFVFGIFCLSIKEYENQNIIFGLKYISNAYTSLKFDMV